MRRTLPATASLTCYLPQLPPERPHHMPFDGVFPVVWLAVEDGDGAVAQARARVGGPERVVRAQPGSERRWGEDGGEGGDNVTRRTCRVHTENSMWGWMICVG